MNKSKNSPSAALKSFMDKYGLNPFSLSKEIGLSYASIRKLVQGDLKISIPTSLKLAKYFSTTPDYWLSLQQQADMAAAKKNKKLQASLKKIKKAVKKTAKTKTAGRKPKKAAAPGRRKAAKKVIRRKRK